MNTLCMTIRSVSKGISISIHHLIKYRVTRNPENTSTCRNVTLRLQFTISINSIHYSPYSFELFMALIFCHILSPIFFAGVNYVLFSRVARQNNLRSFRWTSYAFITSDIITNRFHLQYQKHACFPIAFRHRRRSM